MEDEESVRAWLCRALRELGYTALEASDGREALRLITERKAAPRLVVSGAVMPGMGGMELRDRLASIAPQVPVLLVSGYSMEELLRRGMADRGTMILQKPLELVDLATGVRNLLDAGGRSA